MSTEEKIIAKIKSWEHYPGSLPFVYLRVDVYEALLAENPKYRESPTGTQAQIFGCHWNALKETESEDGIDLELLK